MAKYEIECEQSLGWSHSGEEIAKGKGFVELTDEEVEVLVNLIREKGTTDVEMLELKEKHPTIYDKLDEGYHKMAYKAEEWRNRSIPTQFRTSESTHSVMRMTMEWP